MTRVMLFIPTPFLGRAAEPVSVTSNLGACLSTDVQTTYEFVSKCASGQEFRLTWIVVILLSFQVIAIHHAFVA